MRHGAHRYLAVLFSTLAVGISQSGTLYWAGGNADIPNGTPISTNGVALCGVWNTTTKNWATDSNGTTYVAWSNAPDAWAYLGPYTNTVGTVPVITQAVDLVMNRIIADLTKAANYNTVIQIVATNARTLTLAGNAPTFDVESGDTTRFLQLGANVRLAGTNGFLRSNSLGNLRIAGDGSALSGTVTVASGSSGSGVRIDNTGNLRSVSEFDCRGAQLTVIAGNGMNNQLGDSAIVRLRAANTFSYQDVRGASASTETVSQVVLGQAGILLLNAANGSGANGRLYLAHPTTGIDRGVDGKGTLQVNGDASDAFETDVVVSNGVATGVVIPWMASIAARPVQLDAVTKALVPLAVTTAPSDLSTWVPNSRYRIEGNFVPTNSIPSMTLDTLGLYSTNPITVNIGTTLTDTLTLGSGLLVLQANGGANGAKLFTGGQITSGTNELYVLTGNSSPAMSLQINSAVVGNMALIKAGVLSLTFGGNATNTYTGTTYVNSGPMTLARASGCIAIPGDVVIGYGGTLSLNPGTLNNVNTNASMTIREGGTFTMNDNSSQTFNGVLTINNATMSLGGTGSGLTLNHAGTGLIFDNGGTLKQTYNGQYSMPINLLTDVRYTAASTNQALITTIYSPFDQYLDLSASGGTATTRTFDIADAVGLAPTNVETVVDIPLRDAAGVPATLVKTGTGVMSLERFTGLFSGGAVVTGGTLLVNGPFTTQTVETCAVTNGSSLLTGLATTNGMRVGQLITGVAVASRALIKSIDSASQVTMSAAATWTYTSSQHVFMACSAVGTGGVLVAGTGTLGGSSGVVGPVTVNAGGTLAPGTLTNAVGTFTIVGKLDLSGGGKLAIDLASDSVGDQVVVKGNTVLGGTLDVNPIGGYMPRGGVGPWTILTTTGTVTGAFAATPAGYRVVVGSNAVTLLHNVPGTAVFFR